MLYISSPPLSKCHPLCLNVLSHHTADYRNHVYFQSLVKTPCLPHYHAWSYQQLSHLLMLTHDGVHVIVISSLLSSLAWLPCCHSPVQVSESPCHSWAFTPSFPVSCPGSYFSTGLKNCYSFFSCSYEPQSISFKKYYLVSFPLSNHATGGPPPFSHPQRLVLSVSALASYCSVFTELFACLFLHEAWNSPLNHRNHVLLGSLDHSLDPILCS